MWRSVYPQYPTPFPRYFALHSCILGGQNIGKSRHENTIPEKSAKWMFLQILSDVLDTIPDPEKKLQQYLTAVFWWVSPPSQTLWELFPAQPEVVSKIGRRLNSSWTCQSLKVFNILGWGVRGAPKKFPNFLVQNRYPPGIVRILP